MARVFLRSGSGAGTLLFVAAVAACLCANSGLAAAYEHFLHLPIGITVASFKLEGSLAQGHPKSHLFAVFEAIERFMEKRKGIYPNLDFYCASAYRFLGMPTGLFTPLFACAWGAHIMEQRGDNRLIHTSADYVGTGPRAVKEINERD